MNGHVRVGRLAGVEIAVNWSVAVIVLLLTWMLADTYLPSAAPHAGTTAYWVAGAVGALLLIASLLAHEVAHAIVAKREGVEVEGLTLWMFGGIARLRGDAPTAGAAFRIAAIGPAVSFALGFGFGLIALTLNAAGAGAVVVGTAWWLAVINVVLAIFNLLPGAPLDGGRILAAHVWRRSGDRLRGAMTATRAGQTLAYVLIAVGLLEVFTGDPVGGFWTVLIATFLMLAARGEYAASAGERLLGNLLVSDVMSSPVEAARADMTIDAFVDTHVLHGHYSAYPLLGADQSVQGLVCLQQLRTVPRATWGTTTVGQVAVPLKRVRVCRPSDPVTEARGTPEVGGRALVVENGTLVGIVSPADIVRTIQARALIEGMPPVAVLAGRE